MRANRCLLTIVALIGCWAPWTARGADAADQTLVRSLAQEYVRAYSTRSPTPAKRLEQLLAEDFVAVFSVGKIAEGKAANMRRYREALAQIAQAFTSMTVDYDIRSIRLEGQAAIVFGLITMQGRLKEGDRPYRRDVWETLVFRRTPSGWLLCHEHATRAAAGKEAKR